jgi:hypothetical protein
MDSIEIVKAYFAALDSIDIEQAGQYLSDTYQLVDFTRQPMDKEAMLGMMRKLKIALPNMKHSLSNIRLEENVVRLSVQRSGSNVDHLDLRMMGIGVVPRSRKFLIFPNDNYEFTIFNGKIVMERNVSPASSGRRISGMLKAFGVNVAALQFS